LIRAGVTSDGFIWVLGSTSPTLHKIDGTSGIVLSSLDLADASGIDPAAVLTSPVSIAIDPTKIAIAGDSKLVFLNKSDMSFLRSVSLPDADSHFDPSQPNVFREGDGGWFISTGGDRSSIYRYDYASNSGKFLDVTLDGIEGFAQDATGFWIENTHFYIESPYLYHIKFDGVVDRRLDMNLLYGFAGSNWNWIGPTYPKADLAPGGRLWLTNCSPFSLLIMDWMSEGSSPSGSCGDYLCDSGETTSSCPADCPLERSLYFSGTDGDWNNLSNWWNDSAHTSQASSLPNLQDSVVIQSNLRGDQSCQKGVTAMTAQGLGASIEVDICLKVGLLAKFNCDDSGCSYLSGNVYGPTEFNVSSASNFSSGSNWPYQFTAGNYGVVGGKATFNCSSNNSDYCPFNAPSTGHIYGPAVFNGGSYNDGIVIGWSVTLNNGYFVGTDDQATVDFNDYSANFPNNLGYTFSPGSTDSGVWGNAIFRGHSTNYGSVWRIDSEAGNAIFYDQSTNLNYISGTITCYSTNNCANAP